jgi:hypothetical protein
MARHYTVCLLESHCNSVDNSVCKNLHVIKLFGFFYSFIPTEIPLVYTDKIFPLIYTDEISDEKNSVGKNYYNILMELIRRCFCWNLSIF